MRGRKPETEEHQAAKGAPGKRMTKKEVATVRAKAPQPVVVGNVRPPKWLKKSRKGTEIWNELAPRLQRLNLLSELDVGAFSRYCRYFTEWLVADIVVQKEGVYYDTTDTNGAPTKRRHPAWQAMVDIEKLLAGAEADFGLRPGDRFRIMRDQAAARGIGANLGDLFGGESQSNETEAAQSTADQGSDDVIGILGGFNSTPPATIN